MVNYIPEFQGYSGQGAFRYWCQKVLPLVYDDSLSYYELLNKVVVYLNNTIEDVAKAEGNIDSLLTAYTQLQGYVNDYFDNLDVQEEINHKLDEMAENGELSDLLEPFIPDLVTTWLNEHITPTSPPVDNTLSVSGAAADAKVTGDEIAKAIKSSGFLLTPTNLHGYTNADDFPRNSVIGIGGTIKEEHIANLPVYDEISCVITTNYSMSSTQIVQLCISEKLYATRIKTGSGWKPWYVAANDADTPSYRPFVKNDYSSLAEVPENTAYVFSDVSWSDLPDGVSGGVYFSFRYSPAFKVQIIFCLNTGNFGVWWRVVDRTTYAVELNWQKITSETDLQEAIRSYKYIQHDSLEGFTTANDFPVNTVIGLGSNITEEDIANLPSYGELAYVITTSYASTATSKSQLYIGVNTFAIRVRAVNTWGTWKISANKNDVLKYNAYNLSSYSSMASTPLNEMRSFSASDVTWTDIPEGVNSGSFYSMQVSPQYKMQFLYTYQGTYNIWYRVVGVNDPYTTLVAWHKILAPEDITALENDSIKLVESGSTYKTDNNLTSASQISENIVMLGQSATYPDLPYANGVFLNLRYSHNFNIQYIINVPTGKCLFRVTDRRDGSVFTDWTGLSLFDITNVLALGDSICYGARNGKKGFIGYFNLAVENVSRVSARLSNTRINEDDPNDHYTSYCIYKQLIDFATNSENANYVPDVIISDGGINDYAYVSNSVQLGTFNGIPKTTDTECESLDLSTLAGGTEYLFYNMIKYYPSAQRFFVLTHRTNNYPYTQNTNGYTQTDAFNLIKDIAKVYGVYIIDIFNESMLNTAFAQYVSPIPYSGSDPSATADEYVNNDGIHPLDRGYRECYVPLIEQALRIGTNKS